MCLQHHELARFCCHRHGIRKNAEPCLISSISIASTGFSSCTTVSPPQSCFAPLIGKTLMRYLVRGCRQNWFRLSKSLSEALPQTRSTLGLTPQTLKRSNWFERGLLHSPEGLVQRRNSIEQKGHFVRADPGRHCQCWVVAVTVSGEFDILSRCPSLRNSSWRLLK